MPSIDLRPKPNRNSKDKRPPKEIPFDVALRKFKKAVERSGVLQRSKRERILRKAYVEA